MITKDTIVKGLLDLKKPEVAFALGAAKIAADAFGKPKKEEPKNDTFSLSAFTAKVKADGFRLTKGYYYVAYIMPQNAAPEEILNMGFHLNRVTLPGWRAKTQVGKIYGLRYEIATELEQDPLWMTFNIDIMHKLEQQFMYTTKASLFNVSSYSPVYKEKVQFNIILYVTDENFVPVHSYTFENCIFRTVHNVQYGSAATDHQEITVEVIYETVKHDIILTARTTDFEKKPDITSQNQLKIGPFSTDISLVNQVKDTISNIPEWFKGPTKL